MRSGESDMALVAGCNIMINPESSFIPLSNLGILSPDGVSYIFDERANYYARGEGIAVLALKPLRKALADNDTIRAVIPNTGANQDGKTPGITQPSREAQASLIRETYMFAGLKFSITGYFEAHETGTPIGDPWEAGAISDVFKNHSTEPMLVGSVKPNIGHSEGASGLAALIKVIRILETGIIPGHPYLDKLNPEIPAGEWRLQFPKETMVWPRNGLRRISVDSFGYGGSNAHAIVDDAYHYLARHRLTGKHQTVISAPTILPWENSALKSSDESSEQYRLYVWSASDESGLERITKRFMLYIGGRQHTAGDLDNLAYTLSNRRTHLAWKSYLVAQSSAELKISIESGALSKPIRSSTSLEPTVAFLMTGQGAQWVGMGKELIVYPAFMESLRHAEKYLLFLGCEWMVTDLLLGHIFTDSMDDSAVAQPLCTVPKIALVDLFAEWGIRPAAVVGHSSGEIAAAYLVGAISRESAYKVAYCRGVCAARMTRGKRKTGAMLAVALSEEDVQPYLDEVAAQLGAGRLTVGCNNSPHNVTLTGDEECVDLVKSLFEETEIFVRKLRVPVAYHSSHMQLIASEYLTSIQDIIPPLASRNEPALSIMYSTVSGRCVDNEELSTPYYWVRNMTDQVKFATALTGLCESLSKQKPGRTEITPAILVEVGPHSVLSRYVQEHSPLIFILMAYHINRLLLQTATQFSA